MAPVRQSRTSRQAIRIPRNPEVVRHARHSQSPPMPRAVDADATFVVDGECNRSNGAGRIAGGPVRTRAFTGCLAFVIGALRDTAASRKSDEHTAELQSLTSLSYDVICLERENTTHNL